MEKDYRVELVSLCIIARNEEKYLPALLDDVRAQTFPHDRIEVVLVDSDSDDKTRSLMDDFLSQEKGRFSDVVVLDNPRRVLPAGWNVAIGGSTGDVLLRVDAHASIPPSFVEESVHVLESGEDVCGGIRPTIVKESTAWQDILHLAEESAFGSSVAPYRLRAERRYVSSIFHGAYRRRVFEAVGAYDERLHRTEDNEMHYRIRKGGFRIRLSPTIVSYQFIRCSLRGMVRQKYANGYWIGRTLYIEPRCFRVYHFVPLLFVLALLASSALALYGMSTPLLILVGAYLLADIALSLKAVIESRTFSAFALVLPAIFFAIHLSYGVGTLVGIIVGAVRKVRRKD